MNTISKFSFFTFIFLLLGNLGFSQSYYADYQIAKSELDKENWYEAKKLYTVAIEKGLDETLRIGKEKITSIMVRCLIGRSIANQELGSYDKAAEDLTYFISFLRQDKIQGTEEDLNNFRNYYPEAYVDRSYSFIQLEMYDEACEDLQTHLNLTPNSEVSQEVKRIQNLIGCNRDINEKSNEEVVKFRIIDAEITERGKGNKFNEPKKIKNPPTLITMDNTQVKVYGNQTEVFDIIKFSPKKEHSKHTTYISFTAVDDHGNSMEHRLVDISGERWIYLSYPGYMCMYKLKPAT